MSTTMIFDVESIGLHGEGFAVGWVVIDEEGAEIGHGYAACPDSAAGGADSDREWIREHVVPTLLEPTHDSPRGVRDAFWAAWRSAADGGAVLAADVTWPVEARFLCACIDDEPELRRWEGPYPLVDIASVRLARGLDPLGTEERLPSELPAHNPLSDARQSARLLREAMA